MKKYTPALLTLLVFLLAQGLVSLLLIGISMLLWPEFHTAMMAYVSGQAQGSQHFSQFATAFSLILMAVDAVAVLFCYRPLRYIRFRQATDPSGIRWRPGMLAIAAGLIGAFGLSILTEGIEQPNMLKEMAHTLSQNIWGLIALTIVGPVSEELLFREAIEGEMLRRGASPWAAIALSAVTFGLVHLNLAQGLYAIPLAIIFGIIYYKTRNIVLTSLLHIANNGLVALQLRTLGPAADDYSLAHELGGTAPALATSAACLLVCLLLITIFWKTYQHK